MGPEDSQPDQKELGIQNEPSFDQLKQAFDQARLNLKGTDPATNGALKEAALKAELPYRQAQIRDFRARGIAPASNAEYLEAANRLQPGQSYNPDNPIESYISYKLRSGVDINALRNTAKFLLENEQSDRRKLEIAKKRKAGSPVILTSPDYQDLKVYEDIGWSIDQIINNLETSIQQREQGQVFKQAVLRLRILQESSQKAVLPPEITKTLLDKAGVITLDEAQRNTKTVSVNEFWVNSMRAPNWEPDPTNERCPTITPEFVPAEAVDLRKAEPGTIVYWKGSHPSAIYTLRVEPNGKLTAWQDQTRPGIVGDMVEIETNDNSRGNEDKILMYPGILISQMATTMPYFEFDKNGKPEKPTEKWSDSIRQIYVKPTK